MKLRSCDKETDATIIVRQEHERLIARAIDTGAYENPEDVIGRALEVLRSEDAWLDANTAAISEKIERAFEQFERGEFFSPEQSRLDMERRKAEWLHKHQA